MTNHIIETLPGESEDLALHVQLCEQRYLQLTESLTVMNTTLNEIKASVAQDNKSTQKTYLSWAGFIIAFLLGSLVHILLR